MTDIIRVKQFVSSSATCWDLHMMFLRLDVPTVPTWRLTSYWRKKGFRG
jgi:hypothetical protein